jgi:ribonuclease Z
MSVTWITPTRKFTGVSIDEVVNGSSARTGNTKAQPSTIAAQTTILFIQPLSLPFHSFTSPRRDGSVSARFEQRGSARLPAGACPAEPNYWQQAGPHANCRGSGCAAMHSPLEPRLADPSANEPGLVVDFRDERRALLFDLGHGIGGLPPRVLLRTTHAFVTHTHMDHFAGFDHLLGVGLGRLPRLVVWGGPDFVDQVEHKLRAYTWNVVHRYEVPMRIEAHELREDGTCRSACFDSRAAFARSDDAMQPATGDDDVLHSEPTFRVRARIVDHEMPVLAFALEEQARVRVAPDRIAAMGLTAGAWLRELKQAVLAGAPDDQPIALQWRDRDGEHAQVRRVAELRPLVLDTVPGRRIGYVTDLRFTEANVEQLQALLADCDLLFIESVFTDADRAHAARKNHLTALQAGTIARRLRAKALVPFHFSPRYEGRTHEVVAEAVAAWRGPV